MKQELQLAQLIQQNFQPRELPRPEGCHVEAFYDPARALTLFDVERANSCRSELEGGLRRAE